MKLSYASTSLENFWCKTQIDFRGLAKRALNVLVPFSTTWLCESGFSSLLYMKNKDRNLLNPENELRISLTHKEPRFEKLIEKRKEQKSH